MRPRSAIYTPKRDDEQPSLLYRSTPRKRAIFPSMIWEKGGEEGVGLSFVFILSKIVVPLACIADPNMKSPILRPGRGRYIMYN